MMALRSAPLLRPARIIFEENFLPLFGKLHRLIVEFPQYYILIVGWLQQDSVFLTRKRERSY